MFKKGDIVEFVIDHSLYIVTDVEYNGDYGTTDYICSVIIECDADYHGPNPQPFSENQLQLVTETSDAPDGQILPPALTVSPALGIRTSSSAGSPSRPLGRRASARSRK